MLVAHTVDLLPSGRSPALSLLPDVKSRLDTLGFTAVASTPEAYAAQIRSDIDHLGQGGEGPRNQGRVSVRRVAGALFDHLVGAKQETFPGFI